MNYPQGSYLKETIDKVADNLSVTCIDLDLVFKMKLRDKAYSDYFIPDYHPNSRGYRIMAESIYQILTENDWLPSADSALSSDTHQTFEVELTEK